MTEQKEQYIITNHGHTDLVDFEGTWPELQQYVKENYTQDSLCCVMHHDNTDLAYDWEEITEPA